MAEIGFVGLGVMGSRIAKRLLDAGHHVTGYNRTRDKAQWLLDAGMAWAESPRAVAERAEICFSMVTNTQALRSIHEGPDGLLAGLNAARIHHGQEPMVLPETTMLGALAHYVSHADLKDFQPMKSNFGILPPLADADRMGKRERAAAYASRALVDLEAYLSGIPSPA